MTVAVATATTADMTTRSRTTPLWRTGVRAGLVAAVATTTTAAVASGAGISLEVGGEAIPLAGFGQLTLVCTVIGVLVAKALSRWAATPRRTFTTVTVALTAVSLVPDVVVAASAATKVVLMATHLVAAAIVIPALAGRLQERTR
jgi:hypothetical protein